MKSKRPIREHVCIECGKAFMPSHHSQQTCSEECHKKHRSEYLKAYFKKRPNSAKHREINREWMRNYRAKEKAMKEAEKRKQTTSSDGLIDTAGMNYGKARASKILASVPKINTDL